MLTSSLLYFFTYSSWGLGLLSAFVALSMKLQEHSLKMRKKAIGLESDSIEVMGRKALMSRLMGARTRPEKSEIPEELKNLINRSSGHPEVDEITGDDEVFGVLFKAQSYPPTPDDSEEDS